MNKKRKKNKGAGGLFFRKDLVVARLHVVLQQLQPHAPPQNPARGAVVRWSRWCVPDAFLRPFPAGFWFRRLCFVLCVSVPDAFVRPSPARLLLCSFLRFLLRGAAARTDRRGGARAFVFRGRYVIVGRPVVLCFNVRRKIK